MGEEDAIAMGVDVASARLMIVLLVSGPWVYLWHGDDWFVGLVVPPRAAHIGGDAFSFDSHRRNLGRSGTHVCRWRGARGVCPLRNPRRSRDGPDWCAAVFMGALDAKRTLGVGFMSKVGKGGSGIVGPLLTVVGAAYKYGERVALDEVSFEVEAGRILAVTGPNGSGKSTLLKLIGGISPGANVGWNISYKGLNLFELSPRERARGGRGRGSSR